MNWGASVARDGFGIMGKQGNTPVNPALHKVTQLIQAGQLDPAEQQLRQVLRKTPLNAEAIRLLGDVLFCRGNYPAAFDAYQRSFNLRASFEALSGMAGAAEKLGDLAAAEQCYRAAIRHFPQAGEPHYRLAAVLSRLPERTGEVIESLQRAIGLGWRVRESYLMIGQLAHSLLQDFDLAFHAYQQLLAREANDVDALAKLAGLYLDVGRIDLAWPLLMQAIERDPTRSGVYSMAGMSLLNRGRHQESLDYLRRAVTLAPDEPLAHSSYLFASSYTDQLPNAQREAEHHQFSELADRLAGPVAEHANLADPARRLRLGIVSADLRHHSVAYFLLPLLEHYDRSQLELICYASQRKTDEVSDAMRALVDGWHNVAQLSDAELAGLIRSHGIDLLLDLGNHSPDNRLPVFAWRPAPVQLSWLGYASTTGMQRIDYLLTDRYYTPDVARSGSVERPAMLETYRVFRPSAAMQLPVGPLPALRNGYLTFASLNSFIKIAPDLLALWAELLLQLPSARLIVMVQAPESVASVQDFFASRGIAAERVEVHSRLKLDAFLALHDRVDIALDSYPFGGMTTTVHSLWMGVPTLSLAGERMLSRSGLSLLAPLGLAEGFVVTSREAYLQHACDWSRQLAPLAELRAGLRERLQQSILMDEPAFARDFAATLRRCWQEWCASRH